MNPASSPAFSCCARKKASLTVSKSIFVIRPASSASLAFVSVCIAALICTVLVQTQRHSCWWYLPSALCQAEQ